jgi:hypothetical protein
MEMELSMVKLEYSRVSSSLVDEGGTSERKAMATKQTMAGKKVSRRRNADASLVKRDVQSSVKMAVLNPT